MAGDAASITSSPIATVEAISAPSALAALADLFRQVWGASEPLVHVDLLRAVGYTGGYVVGAYDTGGQLVGGSFGFLADHAGERALHSHVTGILPGVQHAGVGRLIKDHQRTWAAERGIGWITWTFDPLVRRNAWFNIEVLGAEVAEYVVDFYGEMRDPVNHGSASDRLMMAWPSVPAEPAARKLIGRRVEVATPDDIVVLRRTDPAAASDWRARVRAELGGPLAAGARVVGFTRSGSYVLDVPA